MALPLGGRLSERAARANAVAALLRPLYPRLVIYGCSVGGKAAHWATNPNPDPDPDPNLNPNLNPNPNPNQVAYWAAVTAPPGTYAQALIDSGGTMGPASAKMAITLALTLALALTLTPALILPFLLA